MLFSDLGLSEAVMKGVEAVGYEKPTPIQAQAIPLVLQGEDLIGASQTGSGKTAAFALPILSMLGQNGVSGKIRCLILEPTRELAAQVDHNIQEFSGETGLSSLLMHGGVGYGHQRQALKNGVDIITATPGRLLDHIGQRTLSLKDVEILVLDEVDRMLDMGFLPDVRKIISYCPEKRQTLFFSATMPPAIGTFAKWALRDPREIEVGRRRSAAETINHAFYPCASNQRQELLLGLLEKTDFHSVMIFTRTKKDADTLASILKKQDNFRVTVMHSDIRQSDRAKALKGFREGDFDVIIATDLAARGLDISNVSHVINYQVPENAEDYVHRIGRTGRAEKEGDAFTIITAEELPHAMSIEHYLGQKIPRRKLEGFNYTYTALLDEDVKKKSRRRMGGGGRRRR